MKPIFIFTLILSLTLFTIVSANEEPEHGEKHLHEHHAPHGGTLVVFGDEFAHLEVLLNPETGELTGYVLDGEAENTVRIEQEQIEIQITLHGARAERSEPVSFTLALESVPNVLTGEKKGDSSEFSVQSDQLKGVEKFDAGISDIKIKGIEFNEVEFAYPQGNE